MPRQILNDAGIDSGQNCSGDVCVPQIVQTVAPGQGQAVLNAHPAAVKGFGRDIDAVGRRREPVEAAQDREQLGRDGNVADACGRFRRGGDKLTADAVTDAAHMEHIGHEVNVSLPQPGNFGAAQTREKSQRQSQIVGNLRDGGQIVGFGQSAAGFRSVLWSVYCVHW